MSPPMTDETTADDTHPTTDDAPTTDEALTTTDRVDRDALEPVVRAAAVFAGVLVLTALATALPGTGYELPLVPLTVEDLVLVVGTLGLVGVLLYASPRVADLVETELEGPDGVVDDAAGAAGYLVVFVALLLAHQGLVPVGRAVLPDVLYDLGFLTVALVPLTGIARRFQRSLDPLAGLAADAIATDAGTGERPDPADGGSG